MSGALDRTMKWSRPGQGTGTGDEAGDLDKNKGQDMEFNQDIAGDQDHGNDHHLDHDHEQDMDLDQDHEQDMDLD